MRVATRLFAFTALMALVASDARAQAPITGIALKMGQVVRNLDQTETGPPVQTRQQEIIRDLDDLIAELEKECAACQGGMRQNNPSNPLADSTIGQGSGGLGNLTDPGASEKDWANLSARERDRILQSMSEGFPPEYRTVLERYYRRLAEETTLDPALAPPVEDEEPLGQPETP